MALCLEGGETFVVDTKEWLAHRAREDRRLYERYGRPLEQEHNGEYLAIGADGQTILAKTLTEVTEKAVQTFGSGNFALAHVGHRAIGLICWMMGLGHSGRRFHATPRRPQWTKRKLEPGEPDGY